MTDHTDDDLVLHGRKTPLWEKSGYLSNSQLTLTTRRLSQNSLYQPGNYRDDRANYVCASNGKVSPVINPLDNSMKKSVSFTKKKLSSPKAVNAGLTNGDLGPMVNGRSDDDLTPSSERDSDENGTSNRHGKPWESAKWFTNPVHLEKKDYPTIEPSGLVSGVLSPVNRPTGTLGAGAAAKAVERLAAMPTSTKDLDIIHPVTSTDYINAKEYFPITLGAAYAIQASNPGSTSTFSPPAKGLPQPNPTPWKPKRSRSPSRRHRPHSAKSSSSTNSSTNSLDKMYLMTAEMPTIGASTVLLSSPYQHELARLRMERLKLEEAHLLEVKRQEELEKIRGPKPKWYEMKTPQFHYEAHKNNELLQSKSEWQALMTYRSELERASKEFHKSLSHHPKTL